MQVRYDARRRTTEEFRQPHVPPRKAMSTLAHVLALDPDTDSGVLLTPDEQIIRFHRSSVVDFDFERMAVGDRVRCARPNPIAGERESWTTAVHFVRRPLRPVLTRLQP